VRAVDPDPAFPKALDRDPNYEVQNATISKNSNPL
jgi:hypothetical protein